MCHLGCSALLLHAGPSRCPTLAELSPCQPMGPKELQARSRPTVNPPEVNSSQKRAHPNPTKNNQTRPKTKGIKNDLKMLFPTLAQSQDHRQPPNCSPEADHSSGCRSMFFISCNFEYGREDCPLRVHTDEFFSNREDEDKDRDNAGNKYEVEEE